MPDGDNSELEEQIKYKETTLKNLRDRLPKTVWEETKEVEISKFPPPDNSIVHCIIDLKKQSVRRAKRSQLQAQEIEGE